MIIKRGSIFFSISLFFISTLVNSQTIRTVGSGADYSTLKTAFDAINAGTITGAITLQITGSTTETASAVLNASGTGSSNYSSLTIFPTITGAAVTGNINVPLIDLNGADNVTIDGRVGSTGSAKDLIITNTNTGASSSTIRLINSAENNAIKFCTIKGSETSSSAGVIFFSTASAGNGNDSNKIDNNNITGDAAGRPVNLIYSYGSASFENSGNIVSNNNLFDFLRHGTASNGVFLSSYNSGWTISGSSFYETTSFVPASGVAFSIIQINSPSGSGYTLSGNYIGGSSAACGGTWNKSAAYDNVFFAINLNVGTTPASSIQNNTIKSFSWSNAGSAAWTGIQITVGSVNIGTLTGNTIGASTGTGSVTVSGGASGTNVYGINISGSGTINIQNNNIGSLIAANSDNSFASNIYGISRGNTGTTTISSNIIGSTTTQGSIQATSGSTANAQSVFGIFNTTGGTINISNNTIANLTNNTTNANPGTTGLIDGIASSYGINSLTNNSIHDLTISCANSSSSHTASVCAIAVNSTNLLNTITGNTLFNLSNNYSSFTGSIIGLYFGSTGMYHTVASNFIHSLSVTGASSSTASLYGIKINAGATTYSDNIISLGGNTAATIYGIYETGITSNNNNLYFNTVYIGGNLSSGITNKSYALYSAVNTNTRNFRNNIFENARSTTGGTNLHFASYFNYSGSGSLTLDYNDYYAPGTGGVLGYYDGADVTSLPIIHGLDARSLTINPAFTFAGGTTASDYIPLSDKLEGTLISTVSTDYALVSRAATPTMGAYEVPLNLNIDVFKSGLFQAGYSTLKDAFAKINSGNHTGVIEVRIKASITETGSAVLYQSGYSTAGGISNYSSVTIYPTIAGITVSGNFDAPLIDFNGADNATLDGRAEATGTTKDLIISNTNTGTFASAVRFINSAENNLVKYCNISSSCFNAGVGVVNFTSASSGNGNDNNVVEYCNITNAGGNRPINIIFSSGGTGRENSGNIIRNNNIFNFLNAGSSSYGINLSYNSTDWTISGNSFYETTTFAPTGATSYNVIRINTGNSNIVSNNYIGGSEPECAGSPWTVNSNFAHYFCGIFINGGTACSVLNNIIKNIDYTSTEDNPWDGIFLNTGAVIVTGNTIGAAAGTGSITVNTPVASATAVISGGSVISPVTIIGGGSGYTTAPIVTFSTSGSITPATATASISGGVVTGITLLGGGSGYTTTPSVIFDGQGNGYSTSHAIVNASSGVVVLSNNTIGSITTQCPVTYSHGFESIYARGVPGTLTISNNLIGSLTTPNSIQTSSTAVSALQKQDVYGIYSSCLGTTIITGNTVANLLNSYTGVNSASRARGIQTIAGSNTIQNNTVRDISSASGQISGGTSASVIGISQTSATDGTSQTITGNNIYNLTNTNLTAAATVLGLFYAGPVTGVHTMSGNFVYNLALSSSNTGCEVDGIMLIGGLTTCSNNIINLGIDITSGYKIYGIWDESGATNNNSIYFNSVYLGGTVTSGITNPTAALWNKANTSTRNYRNNILVNARSGGTTGKHYAIRLEGMANVTIDYNDYYVSGTGGVIGRIATLDKTDLAAWRLGTSQDLNSLSINPLFSVAGGTSAVNYYTSAVLPAFPGTGITTDYAGNTRGNSPKIGALEINTYTWQGSVSTDFATAGNWTGGIVPPDGSDMTFASDPDRNCVLDQNRTLKDITNAQGTDLLVVNGKQLTITGNLNFTNSAKLDATVTSSVLVFAGQAAQSIPSGALVSNIVDELVINNSNGVVQNGDLIITRRLTLTGGALSIGANTLTINGALSITDGALTGGSSSDIIIGGSGAATLPSVSLNNLTLNRAGSIGLGGAVNVDGTLTLTSGTLSLGANILTISGSSPVRTNGYIDAGNAGAGLLFDNAAAIVLPASLFLSSIVNNLTINGTGGITGNGDFTINGALTLAGTNPSSSKGLLDMGINTLTMGANGTTIGAGDVTGIVKRLSFVASTDYSFGNQYTTITFAAGGTMPTDVSFKITIGSAPSLKTNAITRIYDIKRSGGADLTRVTLSLHYLDTELQSNTEDNLVIWDFHVGLPVIVEEHGKANQNTTGNWVAISNRRITYFDQTFDTHTWGLSNKESADFTWQGTPSSDWDDPNNWSGGAVPDGLSDVVIPDAAATLHDPVLPESPAAFVNTITIHNGGILEGGISTTLTIAGSAGAWLNMGTFNPGTSTVIFTNANATMADPTNFYNVTIANGAALTPETDNIMRVAGALTLQGSGILRAALLPNTIEFNGTDQTIINPNGLTPGYYNLILSGSGTKTLPATALSVAGDFILSGTATATAGSPMTIGGELAIEEGSTFATGAFNHTLRGAFDNSGTFTGSSGYTITLNGNAAQSVYGAATTSFNNLIINNSNGVNLLANVNINNVLTLAGGTLNIGATNLGISGTISKTSGYLEVSPLSSLNFGGTAPIILNNDLFTTSPSLNNITINRSGGVTLGNQNMTINGLLDLQAGTLTTGANTLTIAGSSPIRTNGNIDASNSAATLSFTNTSGIVLPALIFTGSVNNLTINGTGGVSSSGDFTLNGVLDLISPNPSDTKGSLDMLDGSTAKTLTMGADATTIGTGDVTGIIKRTSFIANRPYSFGNQFTTVTISTGGTYPSQVQLKISIGISPLWKTNAIYRIYEYIQTGGNNCFVTLATHYLDSELNGNNENELVMWGYGTPGPIPGLNEFGRSNNSPIDNWVAIETVNIGYFPTNFGQFENTFAESQLASYTWNGSRSNSWTDQDNWTPVGTPSSVSNIIIPDASTTLNSPVLPASTAIKTLSIGPAGILNSGSNTQLTITGDNGAWNNTGGTFNSGTGNIIFTNPSATISGITNFNNVTINYGAGLTIVSGARLVVNSRAAMTVPGNLTNNAGPSGLVLKSDVNGDGKLYYNSSVEGTVELYLTGGTSGGNKFHFFVPPVSSMTIGSSIAEASTALGLNSSNFNGDLISYSESAAGANQDKGWLYFDGYIPAGSGFSNIPFSSLVSSRGYNIFLKKDDPVTFNGTLNGAEHTFVLNRSAGGLGWNLVGNPYPCNYDLTGITALTTPANGVDKTIYINKSGTYVYKIVGGTGIGWNTDVLPPMQGFFVHVTSSGNSLILPVSSKTSSAPESRAKSTRSIETDLLKRIRLVLNNTTVTDETVVCLIDKATSGFDGDYDAYKLFGSGTTVPYIYTELNSVKYAINSVPGPVSEPVRIPLTVMLRTQGTYKIDITEFENLEGIQVVLRHGAVETIIGKNSSYSFTSAAGTFADFELIIRAVATGLEKPVYEKLKTWYSNNFLYINCPVETSTGNGTLIIYDIQGKPVYSNKQLYLTPGQTIQLPLTLPEGVYVTRIITNNQSFVSKIVVF